MNGLNKCIINYKMGVVHCIIYKPIININKKNNNITI